MSGLELLLVALGLSMDAFAVSLAAGTHQKVQGLGPAFRVWFHFGLFQSLMTVAGWFVGAGLEQVIETWDHWVAFGLLTVVGSKMIWAGCRSGGPECAKLSRDPSRGLLLLSLSVATSLDALAVGVSLGVLGASIWQPGVVIGLVTALMSLVGLRVGGILGAKFGQRMEVAGGVVIVLIGLKIVVYG
jgi:putative Mn2+ efflux pump MntP